MASAKAIALMESIYGRVDKQVRDILATLPGVTVPAQQDGAVISAQRRIFNFEGPGVVVTDDPARHRVNVFIPGSPTTAPAASTFISTAGVERVFPLGTAPANWWLPAFVDSGWGLSVLESESISAAYAVAPTAAWITETSINGDNGTTDTQFLTRRTFTLPAGTITSATLEINYDDDIGLDSFGGGDGSAEGMWINGHLIGALTRSGTPVTYATFSIPISWLTAGTSNVLAASVFSQAGANALSYRVTVNMSTAGVDPLYQLLSEKDQDLGYAGLDADGLVPDAALADTGTPSSTTFLRGDRQWQAVSTNSVTIEEVDGTPAVTATTLQFPNTTLTDQGGGVARYTPAAFAGLTTASAALGSNVTMTTANTFYDGASVSLAAGTWFIAAAVDAGNESLGAGMVAAKLWDGTTVYATAEIYMPSITAYACPHVSAIVVLGSTTTVKVSAATQQNGSILRASLRVNGSGNNSTYICAMKIV